MEKLFDETNAFQGQLYRTVWYGFIEGSLDRALSREIVTHVREDYAEKLLDIPPKATHWVFYMKPAQKDALDEHVRASLMVRERDGEFIVNYNMSDLDFVMSFDKLQAFATDLARHLSTP